MNDPWVDITRPSLAESINARRVDPALKWGFFWARDIDGKCLLVLVYRPESAFKGRLPKLRGIQLKQTMAEQNQEPALIFRLEDSSQRDLFFELCTGIIQACRPVATEQEVVAEAVARTWRWHALLRGATPQKLSIEEQKGLIGELFVLKRFLIPHLGVADALAAWTGPLDSPKDFELGRVCIEAKARRGAATPFVQINSEFQLDLTGIDELYLHVTELAQVPHDNESGFTLFGLVEELRSLVTQEAPEALELLDGLLAADGYDASDEYKETSWLEGNERLFKVSEEFPRITPPQLAGAVSRVSYSLSLVDCEPFAVGRDALIKSVNGTHNGD